MNRDRRNIDCSLFVPLAVLWVTIAAEIITIMYLNGGFYFSADDVYINLGLGRRFFAGVAQGEFPSGTTAFGWSLLFGALSRFASRGVVIVGVLGLNTAMATWFVVMLRSLLQRFDWPSWRVAFLLLAIFLVNLPELVILGMEHVVQVTLLVAALISLKRYLESDRDGHYHYPTALCLYVFLAAACRQETLFFAAAVGFVLTLRRLYSWVLGVGLAAILPLIAQGIFQEFQGKSFWSNPIAIKTVLDQDWFSRIGAILSNIYHQQPADVILIETATVAVLFVLVSRPKLWASARLVSDLAIVTLIYAVLHVTLARVGWLGRYQTPIVAIGVVTLAEALATLCPVSAVARPKLRSYELLAGGIAICGAFWTILATERFHYMVLGPKTSWEVRNQMCRIEELAAMAPVSEYVVLNDVGCTTFYLDNPIIDLYGLTSYQVRLRGGLNVLTKQDIDELTRSHRAKMAIIFTLWFAGRVPDEWIPVGHWKMPNPTIAGDATVTVYATAPAYKDEIASRWNAYRNNVGTVPGLQFATP